VGNTFRSDLADFSGSFRWNHCEELASMSGGGGGGGGPPAFAPDDIASMVAWWNGDDLPASSPTTWVDQIGSFTLNQQNNPTIGTLNGGRCAVFNGSNQYFSYLGTNILASNATFSYYFVCQADAAVTANRGIFQMGPSGSTIDIAMRLRNPTTSTQQYTVRDSSSSKIYTLGDADRETGTGDFDFSTTPFVIALRCDMSSGFFHRYLIDGTGRASNETVATTQTGRTNLGAIRIGRQATAYFQGRVRHALISSAYLSNTDHENMLSWCETEAGI
jgi:hypothetical protein